MLQCNMGACSDCDDLSMQSCGPEHTGANACDWWCNVHTCGFSHCVGCAACVDLATGSYCASWCTRHSSPGGLFPFDKCNGCSFS